MAGKASYPSPPASLSHHRIEALLSALRRGSGGDSADGSGGGSAGGPGDDGETEVRMPFSGEVLLRLPHTTVAQVAEAARLARAAQKQWAATSIHVRAAALLRWHDAVLARADELCDVIQVESGKARGDAFEEVADIANTLRYYGLSAAKVLAPRRRHGVFPLLTRTVELRHPYGLVGIISPWNYPLTLAAGDAIPALVAGNAVLHKPDSQTALTTLLIREIALAAGIPAGVWQVVVGDGATVGPAVIDAADHVVFTGSTATGRRVAEQAGRRLVRADLELGGKNAMVVCADARLAAAVEGAVRGSFSSAGQLCLSMERIYVHRDIADEFTQRFAAAARRVKLGAGYDFRSEMGSLVNEAQLAKTRNHIDDAVAHGATVLAGGTHRPDLGPYFFEPTVLADVPETAACFGEETFGPVVSIYPVASDEEAIEKANASAYGLNASVFSRSAAHARSVARRLAAGTVNINESYAAAWGSVDSPMGGVKASGVGRRHGAEGLLASTWAQTIAAQCFWPVGEFGPLRGRRYQTFMTAALRALKMLRRR
jgi:succinate-semialdehyde dehydrogenase/glutarate-semialdehyde dehydrogenase